MKPCDALSRGPCPFGLGAWPLAFGVALRGRVSGFGWSRPLVLAEGRLVVGADLCQVNTTTPPGVRQHCRLLLGAGSVGRADLSSTSFTSGRPANCQGGGLQRDAHTERTLLPGSQPRGNAAALPTVGALALLVLGGCGYATLMS